MKDNRLQIALEAIEQLNIKPEMEQNILREVRRRTAGGRRTRLSARMRPLAAGAAIWILAITAIGIPVSAYVISTVKERMAQIPPEELTEIVDTLDAQPVGADSFSREYTETERTRMMELQKAYNQGTFPAGKLIQVEEAAEAGQLEFYFLNPTSFFHLPDREMTDEELLQIIDFNTQRDYALAKRYEEMLAATDDSAYEAVPEPEGVGNDSANKPAREPETAGSDSANNAAQESEAITSERIRQARQEVKAANEQNEQILKKWMATDGDPDEQLLNEIGESTDRVNQANRDLQAATKAEVIAQGGLDDEAAIETTRAWLQSIYGIDGSDREIYCLLSVADDSSYARYPIAYQVTFSLRSYENHAIRVDPMDGTLVGIQYSGSSDSNSSEPENLPATAATEAKIQETRKRAEDFLLKTLGINEEYQNVSCRYLIVEDTNTLYWNSLEIQFIKADGTAYLLTYNIATDELDTYDIVNYAGYTAAWARRQEYEAEARAQRPNEGHPALSRLIEKIIPLS